MQIGKLCGRKFYLTLPSVSPFSLLDGVCKYLVVAVSYISGLWALRGDSNCEQNLIAVSSHKVVSGQVKVGADGSFYDPQTVSAKVNDTITFLFIGK